MPGSLQCESKAGGFIAYAVELALLAKALRSAVAQYAESLSVRLTLRAPAGGGPATPTLAFAWRGDNVSLGQELPVGAPAGAPELQRLCRLADVAMPCPFCVDLLPAAERLVGVADKLRAPLGAAGAVRLAVTRGGELHLQGEGAGVALGEALAGLMVAPDSAYAPRPPGAAAAGPAARLAEAEAAGEADTATVAVKHLAKALRAAPATQPVRLLAGIAPGGGYVHLMNAYQQAGADAYDDRFAFHVKVPVREDDM